MAEQITEPVEVEVHETFKDETVLEDREDTPKKKSEELDDSDSRSDTPPLESGNDDPKLSTPASFHSGMSSRSTTESDLETASDNIKVVVRVRPLNASELTRNDKNIIEFPGDGALWIDNFGQIKPFTFNAVFEEKTSQAEMFENCGIKHLINMALEGYSCTAFAFGQTGSGKTHTITGPMNSENLHYEDKMLPSPEMLGLIERSFQYMFDMMDKKSDQGNFTLRASYLEVYNERVKDLLNPSSTHDSLPVRWSRDRGFYVENLFYVECDTLDDLTAVLEEGLKYRQVGSHGMNDHSSRSHSLLTVYVDIETVDPSDEAGIPILRHGKISFVDLAGSERVKETKSVGEAFTESQNINKSLLTLGNCISALSDAKKRTGHIPYRDSKLTKLLADSLGGDGVTLMIACISPSSYVVSDTLNTLRYANRAKKIKNKPVVQMDPKEKLIISLKREIKLLRTENNYFRQQLGLPSSDSQTSITNTEENNNKPNRKILKENTHKINKQNSLMVIEDERNKLTTANLTAGANSSLYDMLQEYMMENEHLRSENSELHKSREEVSRQQEIVSRENERLLKKLEDLERVFVSSPISFRTLSGVERTRSLPEGAAGSEGFRSTVQSSTPHSLDYASRNDSHKLLQRHRSSSEPSTLAFPPIKNGPYPNYTSHSWGASPNYSKENTSSHSTPIRSLIPSGSPNRTTLSKSSPAKLRRLPLAPEKHQSGYAQIFAKNREKKSKGTKHNIAKQPSNQPVKALNAHAQTTTSKYNPKHYEQSYSSRTHYQAVHNQQQPGYNQHQPVHNTHQPVHTAVQHGYNGNAPTYSNNFRQYSGSGHENQRIEQDLSNIDSQIQYYQNYQGKPHR